MIDEELYQRATDELNSDRRRPHLWARACALSADDHDEARYLYTNLRVEELIAERERGGAASSAAAPGDAGPLELEPLPSNPPAAADPFASYEPDDRLDDTEPDTELAQAIASVYDGPPVAELDSVRAGTSTTDSGADFDADIEAGTGAGADDDLDAPAIAGPTRPESVRNAVQLELHDRTIDLDPDEIARLNDAEPARPSPIAPVPHGPDAPAGEHPDTDDTEAMEPPHAGGRPASEAPEPPAPHATAAAGSGIDGPSRVERNGLRDVDGQLDEILEEGDKDGASAAAGTDGDRPRAPGPRVRNDYADVRDLDSLLEGGSASGPGRARDEETTLDIVEDDGGRGRRWSVFESADGSLQAVKRGVCWPALLATVPWLLVRGLVGTAIVYALLLLASLGGVALTGVAWLEAGAAVDRATMLAFAGFAAIAVIGLLLVPWLRANRWRAGRLLDKGWELAGELRAPSARSAVERFRELDSGTL